MQALKIYCLNRGFAKLYFETYITVIECFSAKGIALNSLKLFSLFEHILIKLTFFVSITTYNVFSTISTIFLYN